MATRNAERLKLAVYSIDVKDVLGKGSFGVVHKARDPDGYLVAAKCIDRTREQNVSKFAKGLKRLLDIDEVNVVKVFDIYQEENVVWMFMELRDCDLNKYFATVNANERGIQLWIMLDMASGVEYLHSQNIIHRDLKPGNILISRWTAKLADFDVSKFFEEDDDTLAMTSDVGTGAFKAPEFWMRNAEGKLIYHRNVDIYAMGLTFLAMIQDNQKLLPRIETPREDSELFQNIGALISERVRYKVKPQEILSEEKNTYASPLMREVRKLIHVMTKVKPEERITAVEVVQRLEKIQTENALSKFEAAAKHFRAARKDLQAAEKVSQAAEEKRQAVGRNLLTAEKDLQSAAFVHRAVWTKLQTAEKVSQAAKEECQAAEKRHGAAWGKVDAAEEEHEVAEEECQAARRMLQAAEKRHQVAGKKLQAQSLMLPRKATTMLGKISGAKRIYAPTCSNKGKFGICTGSSWAGVGMGPRQVMRV